MTAGSKSNKCVFKPMAWLCLFFILLTGQLISPASARDVPVETAARLQATLSKFVSDASAKDGSFVYLNRETAQRVMLYPSGKHPMVIPFGEDYYLCVTMLDAQGNKLDVDFLLRPKSGAGEGVFLVVDTFVDNRNLLHRALKRN